MQLEYIDTDRLRLRRCDSASHNYVHNSYSEQALMEFFGFKNKLELQQEIKRFQSGMETYNKRFLYFHLIHKKTQQVIGWCGYHTWYTDHHRAELGYTIDAQEFRNHGLMKEALEPIIKYGFEIMKLHRIEAMVGPENEPSLRLIRHFGFVQEGHLKEHYFRNGVMEDSLIFALLSAK